MTEVIKVEVVIKSRPSFVLSSCFLWLNGLNFYFLVIVLMIIMTSFLVSFISFAILFLVITFCAKLTYAKLQACEKRSKNKFVMSSASDVQTSNIIFTGSALVNIRRKALLSSVGFRKRMTSRSPRGSPCDSCKLRFDRPLWYVWWFDVCFELLCCFFDHLSIDSTKKMPLHLFGKAVLMFRLDQAS